MYIHGGIGSHRFNERFSVDYDLPNEEAYAETCAAIALVLFAHRMLQIEADSQYADVMERALYNGILSGVSLDGRHFFYANPLAINKTSILMPQVRADWTRQPWYGCACCPPNIARLIASVGGYMYSASASALYVHLYGQSEVTAEIGTGTVTLEQTTDYPWNGDVRLRVRPDKPRSFSLALRIPAWCRKATIKINGKVEEYSGSMGKGYARLRRTWQDGDTVELTMSMPVERVYAHPAARHNAGRFAIQRGPLLYCIEEADNGSGLQGIVVPKRNRLRAAAYEPGRLGGSIAIVGQGLRRRPEDWGGDLYRTEQTPSEGVPVTAIPYCLWNNRRPGEMAVWLLEA